MFSDKDVVYCVVSLNINTINVALTIEIPFRQLLLTESRIAN